MRASDPTAASIAAIAGAAYLVRYYSRPAHARQREAAIRALGEAARAAFNTSEDFEAILYAIADGLYPFEAARHDGRRR